MRLRQIEVFYAFMITDSTVGAAEHLGITQPAISTALKRMQEELGLELFTIANRRLVPTQEAHTLFKQVSCVYEEVSRLERLAKSLAVGEVGYVRFGTVPAIGESISAMAITKLRKQSKDLRISLEVLNTHELVHRLHSGRLDIACIFGDPNETTLQVHQSFPIPLYCVGAKKWLAGKERITLAEMLEFPMVTLRTTDPIGQLIYQAHRDQNLAVDSVLELRSCRAAIAIAKEETAIGFADKLSIRESSFDNIVSIPVEPELLTHAMIVSNVAHKLTQAEAKFIDELEQSLRAQLD